MYVRTEQGPYVRAVVRTVYYSTVRCQLSGFQAAETTYSPSHPLGLQTFASLHVSIFHSDFHAAVYCYSLARLQSTFF